ncbi:ribosomal protein S12 methylthiotransferase accessory factor [Amycolatopsis xylanica]|uniref:Ribosomal protein S12 methylthiotransferase accessory factor n=1 Tax=Amycolatopsis xylanica TaxID=589385 RepID=A0A1H3DG54_9PSEU|nr:TOMM precursor leader peptide-binding protein [Amycolatopsis xylanica]SDX65462.1 ribosomal protein S12 methylthiotransferase accessory factor [Amycolatopsis xylanica]
MGVPRIKRHLGVSVVPGEGAYLLCEHGSAVVTDPLAERLLPLLNGKHDLQSIVDTLRDEVAPEVVRRAVAQLARAGQVVEVDPDADERSAGYWESLGRHGDEANAELAAGVRVTTFGSVDAEEAIEALWAAGMRIVESEEDTSALDLVLTDDYLRAGLASFDRRQRATGRPWLLAKPVGVIAYVGPIFDPAGACYRCLEVRLRGQRRAEDYLEGKLTDVRIAPPTVDIAASRSLAFGMAATAAAHWLGGHRHDGTHAVLSIDTATLRTETHALSRRPQCSACGNAALVTKNMRKPVKLVPREKTFAEDGGHRAKSPEEMMRNWGHLVDPITGVVPKLTPLNTRLPFVRAYASGYNRALRVSTLRALRDGLRTQSCGKGVTDIQAKASALGEALERYSAVYTGDEPRFLASLNTLGEMGIHPNRSMLFSDRQFAEREQWNAKGIAFQTVAEQMSADAELEWSPVYSLTEERTKYVPTSLLFYSYPYRGPVYAIADSNGCAAGTSFEDAMLQGFYELVERDSVAIWWYNRLRCPGVDLDAMKEPWLDRMQAEYRGLNRELWALDITADLGVPAVVAVSRRTDKPAEDIIFGFGAHHDARIAVLRAVSELNQFLPAVAFSTEDGGGYTFPDPVQKHWWQTATVADHPYLTPDPHEPASRVVDLSMPTGGDLAEDVRLCRRLVEDKGMELLALDLTRPDIGLPVVKVLVPGMRHFWSRYAPGRLYDVPVALGRLRSPTAEADLNPIPMFV